MRRLRKSSFCAAVVVRSFLLFALGAALIGGCGGGGGVDMTVHKFAPQRPDVDLAHASSGALSIPTAQPFNITSFKSGQDGAARGESKAVGANGADCRAEARDGGSAWADFQIGYCFDNVAKVPLSAAVKLRLTVTESGGIQHATVGASDPVGAQQPKEAADAGALAPTTTQKSGHLPDGSKATTTALAFLKFFIKDTNGLIVKEQSLISDEMEKGPHSGSDVRDVVFDARFEPDRGYYLVVAGRTEVQTVPGRSVQVAMNVTQCTLDIVWQGAAAPTTTGAAGGKVADK
jgi:hypothetical protein